MGGGAAEFIDGQAGGGVKQSQLGDLDREVQVLAVVDVEGVDTDDLAVDVDQRAAAVARRDRRGGLHVLHPVVKPGGGGDDAVGEGAGEASGAAQGVDRLAGGDGGLLLQIGVAGEGGLHQGQIQVRVAAVDRRDLQLRPVGEGGRGGIGALHHVVVGGDLPPVVHKEAGAAGKGIAVAVIDADLHHAGRDGPEHLLGAHGHRAVLLPLGGVGHVGAGRGESRLPALKGVALQADLRLHGHLARGEILLRLAHEGALAGVEAHGVAPRPLGDDHLVGDDVDGGGVPVVKDIALPLHHGRGGAAALFDGLHEIARDQGAAVELIAHRIVHRLGSLCGAAGNAQEQQQRQRNRQQFPHIGTSLFSAPPGRSRG